MKTKEEEFVRNAWKTKEEELKTLKDLEIDFGMNNDGEFINVSDLKQEVIKWVKADTKELCGILREELSGRDLEIIDKVLIVFNNIQEEDLK